MKKIIFLVLITFSFSLLNAQTKEELKAEQEILKDSITPLQKKIDGLQSTIDALPGWRFKTFGTIGGSLSGFNNWYSKDSPNSSVGSFGVNLNSTADLVQDKFFWRNAANINISWVKFDDKDDDSDNKNYEVATDIFTLSSLYGYKLSDKFAISALGEYRSTLVENSSNPGFLDLGIGATWTPIKDLVVAFHPFNYNFVFSNGDKVYESSLGAKIVADYTKKLGDFNIKSNLSIFQSYKASDYSNWTWTNSAAYTFWKNFGFGFDFGLRNSKQEAFNYNLETDPNATLGNTDNKLQTYWLLGLHYKLK